MKVLEMSTDSGQIVYVEVTDDIEVVNEVYEGGTVAGGDKITVIIEKLGDLGATIGSVCSTLQKQIFAALGELTPGELTLEFSVKLAGEAGVPLVTKGSAEGTFKVTAKWSSKQTE